MLMMTSKKYNREEDIIEKQDNYTISEFFDNGTNIKYILLNATLDNGYALCIRMPITSINESVKISNEFLYIIGAFVIIFGGIVL